MEPCISTVKRNNDMPYVNKPRPYKKEYQQQKARGEQPTRNARERARYAVDKAGVDKNGNGKADAREGKDIEHIVPLSKGGTNTKKNLRIETPSQNRSFSRNSDHTVKVNKAKPKPKPKNGNTK
jgi:hypothetical protein